MAIKWGINIGAALLPAMREPQSLSVEVVQRKHGRLDVKRNLGTVLDTIGSSKAGLLVLPEMFLTGYTLGDEVFDVALSLSDETVSKVVDAAAKYGKHIVLGMPLWSDEVKGQVHNSAVVISPDGILGRYNKMHLVDFGPFEECAQFTPGRDPLMVVIEGWKMGVMICYDLFFPELSRYYSLKGCDGIICISASPSMTRDYFEKVMVARAIENTVYVVYSNLVGIDARMDFWGGGAMIGPRGETVVKGPYFEEAALRGNLESEVLLSARRNRPTIRDAKPSLFRELARLDEIRSRDDG